MKKYFRLLLALLFSLGYSYVFADPPGPPGPGGDPGGNGGVPVGAPLDADMFVLIALGLFYASYRIYQVWHANRKGKHPVA